jgi:hypothetical protein
MEISINASGPLSIDIDGQEFPLIGTGDEGKLIAVKADGSGYELVSAPAVSAGGAINPKDYGLSETGTPEDNAAAIVSALTAAAGAPVVIPAGSFTIAKVAYEGQFHLTGSGIKTRLTSTSPDAGFYFPIATAYFGCVLGNFTLNHASAVGGTHGVHLHITSAVTGYFARYRIFNIYNDLWDIHRFATNSLYLDNTLAGPGFATGTVEGCQLTTGSWAGIHGDRIGDGNKFLDNVINNGPGIALDLSSIGPGARQTIIRGNNFTSLGGQIVLDGMGQVTIAENWMEHPGYIGNFNGARISGQMALFNCYKCRAIGNTINCKAGATTGSPWGIILNGITSGTKTDENVIVEWTPTTGGAISDSTQSGVAGTPGASRLPNTMSGNVYA